MQPAVKSVVFGVPAHEGVGHTTHYVDISESVSRVCRRSYRQGLNWAVGSISIYVEAGTVGDVSFYKLPDTWCVSNAWHKAYALWQEQRREALKESPSLSAKWSDFKIFAEPEHVANGFAANLDPIDSNAVPFMAGEWMQSDIVVPLDGGAGGSAVAPEVSLHMIGDNVPPGQFNPATTTSAGLITAYAQSRAQVLAPDPVQPAGANLSLYNELSMHDEISEAALHNATAENNEPPYDIANFPGGAVNAPTLEFVDGWSNPGTNSVSNQKHLSGTNFPCGLIKIDNSLNGAMTLVLHLVPGTHRGYLAEPMQDM